MILELIHLMIIIGPSDKEAIHFGIPIGCKYSYNLDFYGKLGIWKNCIF